MKVLFCQFSNKYSQSEQPVLYKFWDKFFDRYSEIGYWRTEDSFEIPKWIAEVSSMVSGELLWIRNSTDEATDKINSGNYDYVLFSVLDAFKSDVQEIISRCPNQLFIVGGYNVEFLEDLDLTFPNVIYAQSMKDTARILGVPYKESTDYSLFKGTATVPRITLSEGCLCSCKFCTVPHGRVIPKSDEVIMNQVNSFKDLKFKLLYIDDKTFGQCSNWTALEKIYDTIKEWNPEFDGFIVQTRPDEIIKNVSGFSRCHIRVVEIGLETCNDDILKKYSKGITSEQVAKAAEALSENGIETILNVIAGFPEETDESYTNTYEYLMRINPMSINPAIYTDYDDIDNYGETRFPDNPSGILGSKWLNKICLEFIKKFEEDLK